ncbi:sugar dehydratase [Candidatus Pacearchaeota archaeon CG10_big_fil_rev_8_21_14_0_10_35_13]|nr:MAG: sugar dehydratase [Candidatus Pacearchaeota archaeon CG10_big_fil_rev_8_21_14_0_10_35_13]
MENNRYWKGKRVLVTGASGFKATYLVDELVKREAEVYCLVLEIEKNCNFLRLGLDKKTSIIYGTVLDQNLISTTLEKYNIDTVFHLAAQPLVQVALKIPYETINTNVIGTLNILEACRNNKNIKRIVIASSDKAYGSNKNLPYDETSPLHGEYPYDVSKSCADLIAQSYGKTYNMPIGIYRSSNIYGGGDLNFDRIIPGTIKNLLFNEPILIRSDGQFIREFLYVKDSVNAYLTLARRIEELGLKGDDFNFGTDKPIKIIELVNMIKRVSGMDSEIKILNTVKAEIKDQYLSSKKAREELSWSNDYELEEGLKETFKWYKEYFGK